jgi:hypothetical protein
MTASSRLPVRSASRSRSMVMARLAFACASFAYYLALIAVLGTPLPSLAQAAVGSAPTSVGEERVKAAYLFRFIGYVEWPATSFPKSDTPYLIGVLQADEVADELQSIASARTVNNRPVIVRKLQGNELPGGLHMVFIGAGERGRQTQLLRQLQQQPIVLVTESEGALAQGSMINFRLVDDRLRFEVGLGPAERSGLKFNSRMLGVASSVIKGPSP